MVGGSVGARVGGPPGAALGSMAGEAVAMFGQGVTRSPYAPKTGGEVLKRLAVEGGLGLATGGAGKGVEEGLKLPFGRVSTVDDVTRLAPKFKRYGGKFTAAQMTDNRTINFFENAVSGAAVGGKRIWKRFDKNIHALKKYGDGVVKDITGWADTLSPQQAGEIIEGMVFRSNKIFKGVETTKWSKLWDGVGTKRLKSDSLEDIYETYPGWKSYIKGLIDDYGAGSGTAGAWDFKTAHLVKSDLLAEGRRLRKGTGTGPDIRNISKIVGKIEDAMGEAVKGNNTAIRDWDDARAFTKLGAETFKETYLAGILKNKYAPEKLGKLTFASGKVQNARDIKAAFRLAESLDPAFDSRKKMKIVKSAYLGEMLFGKANKFVPDLRGEVTVGNDFMKVMATTNAKDTMAELFTPGEIKWLQDFGKTSAIVQNKAPGGGGMAMQLTQAGVLINPKVSQAGKMAGVILGPMQVGKLMTTNSGRRILFDGIKTPQYTPAAATILTRLSAEMVRIVSEQARDEGVPEHIIEQFDKNDMFIEEPSTPMPGAIRRNLQQIGAAQKVTGGGVLR